MRLEVHKIDTNREQKPNMLGYTCTVKHNHCSSSQNQRHQIYRIFLAFNLIVSPLMKIPLPLYGSGLRHSLISAANFVTTFLLTPSSKIRVGCGVLALTPCGTPNSIGWEYPTLRETNCWPGYSGSTVVAVDSTVAL